MPETPGIFEKELIQKCVKGDYKAQEMLYKHFYGYAMGIGLRYLSNRDDALEVVNDAYMKVFKSLAQFNPDQLFKPWFRKVIVNTALDRKRKDLKHLAQVDLDATPSASLATASVNNLTVKDILNLLNTLPDIQRIVFNLYELDGYKHDEISQLLNIPASSSRVHLSRAKEKLKKAWLAEEDRYERTGR
jgi:RNA polymerase sigma-70 factor (ECF subfamily)